MLVNNFRIRQKFARPDLNLIEKFRGLAVANIGDAMGRMQCLHSRLRPLNSQPLLGAALTVRVRPTDNLMVHKAIEIAQPGDVLVIDAQGFQSHAVIGSLMCIHAIRKGISGFVIDGMIRDLGELRNMEIPIYAVGATPNGPFKDGPGEIGFPVLCGGQQIQPGDIMAGDEDGLIAVPANRAEAVAAATLAVAEKEIRWLKDIENGAWSKEWVDEILQRGGCQYVD